MPDTITPNDSMPKPSVLAAVSALRQAQEVQASQSIRKSLQQLVELQELHSFLQPETSLQERLDSLQDWLATHGFIGLNKLKFVAGLPEGAGVVAKEDIQQDSVICRVPSDLIMSTESAREHPSFKSLLLTGYASLRAIPPLLLAMFLLYEALKPAASPSFWKPYIDSLPKDFSLPLYWEEAHWEEMAGTGMMMKAIADFRTYLRHYLTLYEIFANSSSPLVPPGVFTWHLFRWAVSAVLTRQNTIPVRLELLSKDGKAAAGRQSGPELAWCLIPGFDLFNHEEGEATNVTRAPKAVNEGQQIYIAYGNRSNFENLTVTGFTTYPRTLPSDLQRLLSVRRRALLDVMGFAEGPFFVDLHRPPLRDNSSKLMSFVRVFVATKEELERDEIGISTKVKRVRAIVSRMTTTSAMGEANERRAVEWIRGRLALLRRGWTSTIADDTRVLEELERCAPGERNSTWRIRRDIVFVRRTEKQVVEEVEKEVEELLAKKG
ncbi:SET domain-containing protein [Gonapodya prolifera JEL478]|uniref:protein-histidine N-methyltransferase n=1 Tax=Gonapodya prolifera (strain JEL478) TaxID=1344416 RepID=A0A139AYT8_GONPJ|nr:SET domain-containing protein [Gonapodya prolifera JEL478]|eukprot:KXS21889.1 SET domain-containing protein [Gonapodya prolifera JEL478]